MKIGTHARAREYQIGSCLVAVAFERGASTLAACWLELGRARVLSVLPTDVLASSAGMVVATIVKLGVVTRRAS